ncbi:MAG: glutamate 5-kinase [Puniceicoccales bacterium]
MPEKFLAKSFRRIVVKLGTGILTDAEGGVNRERISSICREVDHARQAGVDVCVVSSGAVGLGMKHLGFSRRPTDLPTLQSCAAVGQSILTQTWQDCMDPFGHKVAQILLTREDLRGRRRHVAVKDTMDRLFALGVVPIVNENDCLSTEEIRFGDNDVLSALVSSLIKADLLFILSTAPGLLNLDTGELLPVIRSISPEIESMARGTNSPTAVGGMVTKIRAARIANRSGCGVIIGSGTNPRLLRRFSGIDVCGTLFLPGEEKLTSRKRWLAFFDRPTGWIRIDAGATRALCENGTSLLASGVIDCGGSFEEGSVVEIRDDDEYVFAHGVIAYSPEDLQKVSGLRSEELHDLMPDRKQYEVVHRNELVLLDEVPHFQPESEST